MTEKIPLLEALGGAGVAAQVLKEHLFEIHFVPVLREFAQEGAHQHRDQQLLFLRERVRRHQRLHYHEHE